MRLRMMGLLWAVLLLALPARAELLLTPYMSLAAGYSWQRLPDNDPAAGPDSTTTVNSETLYVNGGIEWLPGLSTGLMARLWGDRNVNTESEVLQFDGISIGWDVTLRLPLELAGLPRGTGPYWRYGQHCWAAAAAGIVNPWAEDDCSPMQTWGINFSLPDSPDLVIFAEYARTDFLDIESRAVIAGVQARF